MRHALAVVTACAALSTACDGSFAGFDCSRSDDRQATIDTSGASEIRVIAEAGSLKITGHDDRGEVRASGTACASSRSRLEAIELLTRRDGDVVVIETVTARGRLDLNLEVPDALPLVVEDGSGSVLISDVEALSLTDRSGSIAIEEVAGNVWVTDGSGSLDIEEVGGTVTVEEDGSGSIKVETVDGDVIVTEDGSGSIRIVDVAGDVLIEEDGSGSIRVEEVRGDFAVLRDGSGGIRSDDIGGHVSVP